MKKHIFLVGYCAEDKKQVGTELSQLLEIPFYPEDSLPPFPQELSLLEEWDGGILCIDLEKHSLEELEQLKDWGYTVFLSPPGGKVLEQLLETQPLICEEEIQQIAQMLIQRDEVYRQLADVVIFQGASEPQRAEKMVEALRNLPDWVEYQRDESSQKEESEKAPGDKEPEPSEPQPSESEEPTPKREKESPQKKQKKKWFPWILGILLGGVLMLLIGGFVLGKTVVQQTIDLIHYEPSDWNLVTPSDLVEADGTLNVLLIGTDENTQEFSETARADSIMIASVNIKTGEARLISLERGIGVPIDGVGDDWLTHVFAYGGGDLLVQTVREEFDLNISHYARVNFQAFEKIIDVFGGVMISLTPEEAAALQPLTAGDMEEGDTFMNGHDALQYARLRSIDSDFQRIERQRNVIQQVVYQFGEANVTELYHLAQEALPYVQTNITPEELTSLTKYLPKFLGVEIQQMTIPEEEDFLPGTYTSDGRVLTQIDKEASGKKIRKFIYGT